MADERTVNGVRVYQDSAGFWREFPIAEEGVGGGADQAGIAAALNQVLSDKRGTATLDLTKDGATVEIAIDNGQGVLGVDITGLSGSGATVVATSTVGLIEFPLNMARVGAGGTLPMSAAEDSSWRSSVVAKTLVRIKVLVAGTGTAQIAYALSTNASLIQMSAPIPPGSNNIGDVDVLTMPPVALATGQKVTVTFGGAQPVTLPANTSVSVSNFPATQTITGAVAATQSGSWSVGLTGTLPGFATTPTFNIGTAPTLQVADNGGSLTVDTGGPGVFAITQPLPAGTNSLGSVVTRAAANAVMSQVPVQQAPVRLVAARATRQTATIAPSTSGTYYLGTSASMTTTSGSIPLAGVGYTHDAQTELWAIAGSGTITFGIADEFN